MLRYVAYLSNNKYIEIKITQVHHITILIKTQHISMTQFNYDTIFCNNLDVSEVGNEIPALYRYSLISKLKRNLFS
jgi:hypothetical protein